MKREGKKDLDVILRFWVGENTSQEFWVVFPQLGSGGYLVMNEKEKGYGR